MTSSPDPFEVFENLRETYFRYYGTPFRLANEKLNTERRDRLDQASGVWQPPLFEARPRYESAGRSLSGSCELAGADPELADFISLGMFKGLPSLYWHQEKSLEAALKGEDIAAVPGTGSGKTETLFLPVLARLIKESRSWGPTASTSEDWWSTTGTPFVSQREGEAGREAAVRAFVLYPMNALADDQLVRLRKTLDSAAIHDWLDANRNGHRFYFGRYTGNTPGLGDSTGNALDTVRDYMRQTAHLYQSALKKGENKSFFVPRPLGAEAITRWDILSHPPDILITNYSMLHVMLMRNQEQVVFEKTADWLRKCSDEVISLIVDESHLYRGTAGTEVGYMIRLLVERLGLASAPERLQVLTGSASLKKDRDEAFLMGLFAKQKSFTFIEGKYLPVPRMPLPLNDHVEAFREPVVDAAAANALFDATAAEDALLAAFHRGDAGPAPAIDEEELAERLFPDNPLALEATKNAIRAAAMRTSSDPAALRLRTHFFFRNVPGVWACIDPQCSAIELEYADPERTVGRLYAEPQTRCGCGARVLELHYCQDCGDVYLGGFTATDPISSPDRSHSLLADVSDLARLPDQARLERLPTNYILYWPRLDLPETTDHFGNGSEAFHWGIQALRFRYAKASLNSRTGDVGIVLNGESHTGWVFQVIPHFKRGAFEVEPTVTKAVPTQCASCGSDWERRFLKNTDPDRYQSPVRLLRTGFEKINQVLVGELANALGDNDDRKLILFSDSRQDAAKLSAGIGIRHYQDLIRSVFIEQMHAVAPLDAATLAMARDWYTRTKDGDEEKAAAAQLRARGGSAGDRLRDIWEDGGDPEAEKPLVQSLVTLPTIPQISLHVRRQLVRMGVNPGGPYPSVQRAQDGKPWTSIFDFSHKDVPRRDLLTEDQEDLLIKINSNRNEELYKALAGGAGRDIESLGLGWIADLTDSASEEASGALGLARASLRLLLLRKRIDGIYRAGAGRPSFLRQFWQSLGEPDEIEDDCRRIWGSTVTSDWVVRTENLVVRAPAFEWICSRCNRRHLIRGAGICTRCRLALPNDAQAATVSRGDYYAWKAETKNGRFRFNTAELTGQTDREDAQSRQMRFQGVFLDQDAIEVADELDLLSVTTTLEAGVDIGDLNAVVMANMPPTRFNYQQRAGRAGRRETNVAYAMTVCRGRSHDEYYFERPHAIANEQTPPPYLTFNREAIFHRVLRSELLRRAFAECGTGSPPSLNPHGDFGQSSDWTANSDAVTAWFAANREVFERVAAALTAGTPLRVPDPAVFLGGLVEKTAEVTEEALGAVELSERLSHRGLLPMFGFPTRVRYMYLERPSRSNPWPPANTIDRDLALAISSFAPGAQTVRDGSQYRSCAIVAYQRGGYKPVPVADPLGPTRPIDQCRSCGSVQEADTSIPRDPLAPCPQCSADPRFYKRLDVREPLGFGSSIGKDFDGQFAWSSRAGQVRALGDPNALEPATHEELEARSGSGMRLVLNDNSGALFRLRAAKPGAHWQGYYAADAVDWGAVKNESLDPEVLEVALGASQHTDIAFFGGLRQVDPEAGLRSNLVRTKQPKELADPQHGRRAAWYSMAFLIRTAAAARLDVQPFEFSAEIHVGRRDGEQSVWTFLADTLENGAGFSTHLASQAILPSFVARIDTLLSEWGDDAHSKKCSASCYKCLRDYANMSYHALLDWRLARDLFNLSLGRGLIVPPDYGIEALRAWAESYDAGPTTQTENGSYSLVNHSGITAAVIVRHPLEAYEDPNFGGLVTRRIENLIDDIYDAAPVDIVVAVDQIVLDRTPREALGLVDSALASANGVSW